MSGAESQDASGSGQTASERKGERKAEKKLKVNECAKQLQQQQQQEPRGALVNSDYTCCSCCEKHDSASVEAVEKREKESGGKISFSSWLPVGLPLSHTSLDPHSFTCDRRSCVRLSLLQLSHLLGLCLRPSPSPSAVATKSQSVCERES